MPARVSPRSRRRSRSNGLIAIIVLGGAGVLALGMVLSKPPAAKPAPAVQAVVNEFDMVQIPVPADFVAVGTRLKDVKFKTVSFPKHQVPAGALLTVANYLEGVAIAPLPANLPLFAQNLSLTARASNPVIDRIPDGMRAMTIRVDATAAVEGWAGSGAVVDVLLVQDKRTTVVAEKVKILSAERSVSPVEGTATPNVPTTVTLLVTQEQCLAINTAIPIGKIAFALRSLKDEANWGTTRFSADSLTGGDPSSGRRPDSINAYVEIKDTDSNSSQGFALSNDKWVKTTSKPDGFFVAGK